MMAVTIASQCNNAQVTVNGSDGSGVQVIGDPTEAALLVMALKAGVDRPLGKRHVL